MERDVLVAPNDSEILLKRATGARKGNWKDEVGATLTRVVETLDISEYREWETDDGSNNAHSLVNKMLFWSIW